MSSSETAALASRTAAVTRSYLTVTAALAVLFRDTLDGWPWIVAAHVAGVALLAALARASKLPLALRVVRDWHPVILFPVLYKEVETLAAAFGNWELTDLIPRWEASLFGGQPAVYLSAQWNWVWLSEYLHFCYLAYVLVIPGVAGWWYASGRRTAFHELMLLLALGLFGSYLFFVLFPVDSPYYLTERLGPPLSGHLFFDLVHEMSSRGGARGGAFPSAHVSGAVIVWLVAWRHEPRVARVLTPIIAGVIVATVYGRFHYVLDTVAGVGVAVMVVTGYSNWRRMTITPVTPATESTPTRV